MPVMIARVKKSSSMSTAPPFGLCMIVIMIVVMPVIGVAVVRDRPVLMQHPAVGQVGVVVLMLIHGKAGSS